MAAAVAAVPLTYAVRSWARATGRVAKPRADRWHRRPTALFGGVAIFFAFLCSYASTRGQGHGDALMIGCASAMFLLGVVDDFLMLKPYAKLVGQIVISTALTTGGMRLHFLPWEVLDQALSIFWLVAITNALNLLDNLDGLSAGVAAVAAGFLAYFCHVGGQPEMALTAAALAGAAVGFLVFNFNPASIFMGDGGSLFLGFVLGSVAMATTAPGIRRNVVAMLAVPVLVLLVPIVDTALVTLMRSLNGRPVSQGGRDHTSHRLVAIGFSERSAALLLWGAALVAGFLAVLLQRLALPMTLFVISCAMLVVVFAGLFVGRVKVYTPVRSALPGSRRTLIPTLAEFAYKRRVFEVLCDLTVIVMAYYASFMARFDGNLVEPHYSAFRASLPLVIATQMLVLLSLGIYKGVWRRTSLEDLGPLLGRILGAWAASVAVVTLVLRLEGVSRAVLAMDGVLLLVGVGGSRLIVRWMSRNAVGAGRSRARGVLIYDADDMGEIMLRIIQAQPALGLQGVGFLDDNLDNRGRRLHGLRVLGPLSSLQDDRIRKDVAELVVWQPALDEAQLARLRVLVASYGLDLRCLSFDLQPVNDVDESPGTRTAVG